MPNNGNDVYIKKSLFVLEGWDLKAFGTWELWNNYNTCILVPGLEKLKKSPMLIKIKWARICFVNFQIKKKVCVDCLLPLESPRNIRQKNNDLIFLELCYHFYWSKLKLIRFWVQRI